LIRRLSNQPIKAINRKPVHRYSFASQIVSFSLSNNLANFKAPTLSPSFLHGNFAKAEAIIIRGTRFRRLVRITGIEAIFGSQRD
jgi:hypothetical protein